MPLDLSTLCLWLLNDVHERLLRFIGGIDELDRAADPGERAYFTGALGAARQQFEVYHATVATLLNQTPDLSAVTSDVLTVARNGLQEFVALHARLVRLFPIWTRPSSDLGTFAANSIGLVATRKAHRELFFITYGRYNAWTGHWIRSLGLQTERVATIPIPFVETLTPLRWPFLPHELGHWLIPGMPSGGSLRERALTLIDQLTARDTTHRNPTYADKVVAELFADQVAFRYCGMAYAYALLCEASLSFTDAETDLPWVSVLERLRRLSPGPAAELAALVPKDWNLDRAKLKSEQIDPLTAVVVELMQSASWVTFCPEGSDDGTIEEAKQLLLRGELASAVFHRSELAAAPELSRRELERAYSVVVPANKEDEEFLRTFRMSAVHRPCTDAEILTAGWHARFDLLRDMANVIYEGERLSDPLITDGLPASKRPAAIEKAIQERMKRLAKRDGRLAQSLQVARVHRWLVKYDPETNRRLAGTTVDPGPDENPKVSDHANGTWTEDAPLSDVQLVRRMRTLSRERPSLARHLVVRPLIDPEQIGTVTVDLRLGTEWELLKSSRFAAMNPGASEKEVQDLMETSSDTFRLTAGEEQEIVIHPGDLVLALTLEYLKLPPDLFGTLEGRSTWARLGLQVHATAGMVDPGFEGYLTLELQNTGRVPLVLFPGLRVGQMAFFPVPGVKRPYDQKPTASYSLQSSARSAFPSQHELKARRAFMESERKAQREAEDRTEKGAR